MKIMALRCVLNVLKRKCHDIYLQPKRCRGESICLVGRDFVSPEDFTSEELKGLMWSALDFKCSFKSNTQQKPLDMCNCNAAIIMKSPHFNQQVSISNALNNLGCYVNVLTDQCWEESACGIVDLGRSLSKLTKVLVPVCCEHSSVEALRDGATVPVINFSSSSFQMIECLANIMTAYSHYGFLRNLKLCWIGPPDSALNAYIILCSKLQMCVQFMKLYGDKDQNQEMLMNAMRTAMKCGGQVTQVCNLKDAIYRANIIVTTKHSYPEFQITSKVLSEAAINWILLHHLPRSNTEVSPDVFSSRNNLTWEAYGNTMWIVMAVAMHLLKGHHPAIEAPDFDGDNMPAEEFYQS